MNVRVRPTEPDDLEEIFRIQADPAVRAQQHRYGVTNSAAIWRKVLFEAAATQRVFTSATILVDEKVAGHIGRIFSWHRRGLRAKYGWNLAPQYWGHGIMPKVLSEDFTTLFADRRVAEIIADCFRDNPRCLRVLTKLGCRPTFYGPLARLHVMVRHRCFRWIVRHRMTRAMWEARSV